MKPTIYPKLLLALGLLGLACVLLVMSLPVLAASPDQVVTIPSPTPGPDGRILYIVQPNDTLLKISLLYGVPVDELRGLEQPDQR